MSHRTGIAFSLIRSLTSPLRCINDTPNRISRDTDGRTENYLYNSRNQLTQLTGDDKNISYTYDPAGNLTEEHSTEHKKIYSYDTYNRNTEINGNDFT